MDFTGKVAIVTGGGGGIGRATSIAFARAGARVMVVDRDANAAQDSAAAANALGTEARSHTADVARAGEVRGYVQATLDAWGRIDCFFNNAGIEGVVTPITEYDEELFDAVIAVNLKGVFLGLRHVLPVMVGQGGGTVVNTASTAGLFGSPGMAAYTAAKHGVLGLTKTAAVDVGRAGVRVNAVCPGPVETRMMRSLEAMRNPADPEAVHTSLSAGMPTGRYTRPEEIANAVLFLSSELSGNLTGTHILIDGGRSGSGGMTGGRANR